MKCLECLGYHRLSKYNYFNRNLKLIQHYDAIRSGT